jgi:trehalose/maltose hydrolase-like predicted phosphorylase
VISQDIFPVDPWHIREVQLDLDLLDEAESLFALSNGHLGLRGNLDEGEPNGLPGTYLNSFFETRPLPYAEAGFGYPEAGQTLVNVTNGKLFRLLVDDEPFDVRYGELLSHERTLDLRAGTLTRDAHWCSPAGKQIKVHSTRLVSLVQRSVAAIEYVVEAVDEFVRVTVQSELVTNEDQPDTEDDPRVSAALKHPLQAVHHEHTDYMALLVHQTRGSELMMAAAMDHDIDVPGRVETTTDAHQDLARTTVICGLRPGQKLRITKYLAYGWSSLRSRPALRDQVSAAIAGARYTGWQGLLDAQRQYLDEFWDCADVEVEGDADVQQAVRFGLFHVLQASARAERRAIPGKGLTGNGYDGHAFWDTEGFVLPVLTYTVPSAAADALRWRATTLDLAKERAKTLSLEGAAFPWRTIRGEECSAYWPAGTAAWHVNADIAMAFERYRLVTGDGSLERECGLAVLVETARLWMSLGHHDRHGVWHLDGVTGPDEYTAVVRDNVFTNLMAAGNLRAATEACLRHPDAAHDLGVSNEETAAWRDAADAAHIPFDEELGVHQQHDGFTTLREWDFDPNASYPLLLTEAYVRLYPSQVVKQADLVLAMQWQSHAFTDEQKARNVDYYERRTTRDSSLSACTQAVMCADVGHLELAHDYTYEAALIDLRNLHKNTRNGLHMASLAGGWTALVGGFGGLRDDEGVLSLNPQLPDGIGRLRFRLRWRDFRLTVDVTHDDVAYTLRDGPHGTLTIRHAGEDLQLSTDAPTTVAIKRRHPLLPAPHQPPGCEPMRHRLKG